MYRLLSPYHSPAHTLSWTPIQTLSIWTMPLPLPSPGELNLVQPLSNEHKIDYRTLTAAVNPLTLLYKRIIPQVGRLTSIHRYPGRPLLSRPLSSIPFPLWQTRKINCCTKPPAPTIPSIFLILSTPPQKNRRTREPLPKRTPYREPHPP